MCSEDCAATIIEAIERKARKMFIPFKAYVGIYLRPIFPDIVDMLAFSFSSKL